MHKAKRGDTVSVRYTAKLADGTISSRTGETEGVQFTVGAGQVIPGLEKAVIGMEPGESKTATIPPEQAYGQRSPERVVTFARAGVPQGIELTPGAALTVHYNDGSQRQGVVASVTRDSVVVDANHPLAGKDLTVDLTLVGIKE